MSTVQIILLVLAIIATLYELIQVLSINVVVARHGRVTILPSWYLGMLTAVGIQVAFILSIV